ncbi:unnamed protein product [Caenorhabditis auriculariae]|uniref:Saposin B-type domain-containing protein n=1 Tax=Caenorhabditis auriculariae TaxID=2777116 RepID=A0A8S1GV05_9PELO|nr:unnamed protein product [Caenorhabditis auriculariae]
MKTVIAFSALFAVSLCLVLPRHLPAQFPVVESSLGCQMCELAVKTYVGSADKDVTSIKKTFDAECKKMFHTIPFGTTECDHFVNNKLDPIIKELESGTAPADVCKKVGEC